jgi:hypothetical protein
VNYRPIIVAGAVVALGIMSACGGRGAAGQASPNPANTDAIYVGRISTPIEYVNAGVSLAVPDATSSAKISWSTAYSTCDSGDAICGKGALPTISLAVATARQAGNANPDGSIAPLMKDTLVYVMTFNGIPCIPKGGPPVPSPTHAPPTQAYSCVLLNFIDANSGQVLYSVESPDP